MKFYTELELRTDDPASAGSRISDALRDYKVVKIIPGWHISDLRDFYDRFIEKIGRVITIGEDFKSGGVQTGERWMEIRYDQDVPDVSAYRHSKNAQPLHTDESYIPDPANIMFFYCINKAESGGATTFVDGPVLVDYLKVYHPELLEKLVSEEVTYTKGGESRTSKIIDLKDPENPRFNFNYYCLDPEESEEHKKLNQDFFEVLKSEVAFTYMAEKVTLRPGEAVAWWDEFVLHGRDAYKAEKTNDRFIWKAGIKYGE